MKHLIDQKPNRLRRLTWHFSSAILNCFSPNACLASFISCFTSLDIARNIHRWLVYLRRLVIGYKFEVMMPNYCQQSKRNQWQMFWYVWNSIWNTITKKTEIWNFSILYSLHLVNRVFFLTVFWCFNGILIFDWAWNLNDCSFISMIC